MQGSSAPSVLAVHDLLENLNEEVLFPGGQLVEQSVRDRFGLRGQRLQQPFARFGNVYMPDPPVRSPDFPHDQAFLLKPRQSRCRICPIEGNQATQLSLVYAWPFFHHQKDGELDRSDAVLAKGVQEQSDRDLMAATYEVPRTLMDGSQIVVADVICRQRGVGIEVRALASRADAAFRFALIRSLTIGKCVHCRSINVVLNLSADERPHFVGTGCEAHRRKRGAPKAGSDFSGFSLLL